MSCPSPHLPQRSSGEPEGYGIWRMVQAHSSPRLQSFEDRSIQLLRKFADLFAIGLCLPAQQQLQIDIRSLRKGEVLRDRKSTRLNSSHVAISYAVFCLKKKTRGTITDN